MAQVSMTLISKDGTELGTYQRNIVGRIPDIATQGGRTFILKRISSGKDKATYGESDIYDLNGA